MRWQFVFGASRSWLTAILGLVIVPSASAGTAFTYQGRLYLNGMPLDGTADLRFRLYDSEAGGTQIGPEDEVLEIDVLDGLLTTQVDFGLDAFNENPRWVEIDLRSPTGVGAYATLAERQELTGVPVAQYALGPWTKSADDLVYLAGNVGMGTTAPGFRLTVSAADQFAGSFASSDPIGTRVRIASSAAGGRTHDLVSSANGNGNGAGKLLFVDSGTPRMAIDSSGFVGIGTVTPSARLSVGGGIHADGTSVTHSQGAHLEWNKSGSQGETWLLNQKGLGSGGLRFGEVDTANLVTERMRISNAGNLGIGSTNPGFRLTVDAADQYAAGFTSADPIGTRLRMTSTATGGRGYDMVSSADGNSNGGGKWVLSDSAAGARMVVDSSGRVGIGVSDPSRLLEVAGHVQASASAGSFELVHPTTGAGWRWVTTTDGVTMRLVEISTGFIRLSVTGGNVGIGRAAAANAFEVEGNASKAAAGSWLANSDARIKTKVETVQNALDVLDRVRLVSFEYADRYKADHPAVGNRRHLNVIAQEFAQVFPDYVQSSGEKLPDGQDILQVDTYPLTIYSAAGVQELHGRVRELESVNSSLKADNAELRSRLERIESLLAK